MNIEFDSTTDLITFIVAALGIGLSLYNFISELAKNCKKIDIKILNVFVRFGTNKLEILNLQFVNRSREAITISQMEIGCNDIKSGFGKRRHLLLDEYLPTNGIQTNHGYWYSDTLPLRIEALGYVKGLFIPDEGGRPLTNNTECVAYIYTNKGRIKKRFKFSDYDDAKLLSKFLVPDWQSLE